ncbi:MAG: stage III sporulation protein AE, partial [Oscillospiraceae bacterium]
FKAERLTKLLGNGVKWGLTIMLTVFVGVVGIQSIAASGADGLSVKITKFATSNFIPVVGGVLAESVETVLSCSVVIKNSVGVLGIIIMTLIAATPLLKIIATLIIFRLTAAISEPIADPKIVQCITELANSIGLIFSMLAAVTIMFIIVITIMLNAGNTAVLLGR